MEADLRRLLDRVEQRERVARRRAILYSLIPILVAVVSLLVIERKHKQLLDDNKSLDRVINNSFNARPIAVTEFNGVWKNVDDNTRGLTKLDIQVANESVSIDAWGRCHPEDCHWGRVPATPYARDVSSQTKATAVAITVTYKTSFEESTLVIRPAGSERLEVEMVTRFTDNSGRSSYANTYIFQRAPNPGRNLQ